MAILVECHCSEATLMRDLKGGLASHGNAAWSIDERRDLPGSVCQRHQQQISRRYFEFSCLGDYRRLAAEFEMERIATPALFRAGQHETSRCQPGPLLLEPVSRKSGGYPPVDAPQEREEENDTQRQKHPPGAGGDIRHLIQVRLSR